ncbi:MAG TPA: exodeoxyribonuclease VII large subunit [Bacteroidota bacterium]|nr:exodeoxyribonuclease VII large subunit [Bacteroidota bacterium]
MNTDECRIVTVTEITRQIKGVLELGFSDVWVQGELSNMKFHTSGHWYFTVKDEGAQISAVMWRSRTLTLPFRPQDGMQVIVRGRISVYEPRGNYQLDCLHIQPMGVGALQMAFERLKRKLEAEGLFDQEHKLSLPAYPQRIGIVTSPTGAAVRDMLSVFSRRFPALEVFIVPAKVQGIGAAEEVAAGIALLNEMDLVDVIIFGRGGGSLEDLWAFNEEVVARAVYDSHIPVISAVGHEIDFSICDFVADLRAPTPSVAAELAVKDRSEVTDVVREYSSAMTQALESAIETHRDTIKHLIGSYAFNKPVDVLRQRMQYIDDLERRCTASLTHRLALLSQSAGSMSARMLALDPRLALKRGYAVVRRNGSLVSSTRAILPDDLITVEMADGEADAVVRHVRPTTTH